MIGKHQQVSREEINELLLDKLPEVLNENQKMDKIHNLVSSLSGKRIRNIGGRRTSKWVLVEQRPLVKLGRV
jgi:ATP-dependent DNA helicase RecG